MDKKEGDIFIKKSTVGKERYSKKNLFEALNLGCFSKSHSGLEIFFDLPTEKEKVQSLSELALNLFAILEVVDNPIVAHDKNFNIIRCNSAYLKLIGKDCSQILNKYYGEFFPLHAGNPRVCICKLGNLTSYKGKDYFIYSFPMENPVKECYQLSIHVFKEVLP